MAIDLDIHKRQALERAGFTPAQIKRFQTGTIDNETQRKMWGSIADSATLTARVGGNIPKPSATVNAPKKPYSASPYPTGASTSNAPSRYPSVEFPHSSLGNKPSLPRTQAGYPKGWTPGGSTPRTQGGYPKGWQPGALPTSAPKNAGYPKGWQPGALSPTAATPDPGLVFQTLPGMPGMPAIDVPDIVAKDFLPQATEQTNAAFAPLFAALEASKGNIQQQGDRSTQMVGGMYDQAIKDLAAQDVARQGQGAANKQAVGQAGQELVNSIGQNYGAANTDVANLISKIGGQQAAGDVLGQSANEQAWQQGQAQQNNAATASFLDAQNQNASDYAQQYGNTVQNQGMVAKEGIANDVAKMLAGVDMRTAEEKTNAGRTALDISGQLRGEDLSTQQANAGLSMQEQTAARDAIMNQYRAQVDAINAANDNLWKTTSRNDTLTQQDYENRRAALEDQAKQKELDRQYELERQKAGGSSAVDLTGNLSSKQQIAQQFGQSGVDMYDNAQRQAQRVMVGDLTPQQYLEQIRYDAVNGKQGWNENDASTIAIRVLTDMGLLGAKS